MEPAKVDDVYIMYIMCDCICVRAQNCAIVCVYVSLNVFGPVCVFVHVRVHCIFLN